jgi:predicted ATP-grasp superfamily ATP-dependent carboligase
MKDSLEISRKTSDPSPVKDRQGSSSNESPATRQVTYDVLVLDARLRQSLTTVRSLGRRGLRVAALGAHADLPTFSSRWCQQAFVCEANEGTEEYFTFLEQLLDRTGVRVLIASADGTIALLRRHRAQLEQRVRIALAKEPALGIAINKEQTLEVAKQLGLGVPPGIKVSAPGEVASAVREIGLPAVVKPVESWAWNKQQGARVDSRLVITPDEARRAVEELTSFGGTTLFQQFLPGRRESLGLFYAHGEIYARFAQWTKRSDPPLGGVSVLHQCIAFPSDIGIQAERLVREIQLEGYSQFEFRRDRAGHPYLMEINPRLNMTIENAVRAGVDFPYLLYQWANGEAINRVESYRTGGWMRDLRGDLMTTIAMLRQRGRPGVPSPARVLWDFCVSFAIPTGYPYVDWKDPLPAWKATSGFARNTLQQMSRQLLRR